MKCEWCGVESVGECTRPECVTKREAVAKVVEEFGQAEIAVGDRETEAVVLREACRAATEMVKLVARDMFNAPAVVSDNAGMFLGAQWRRFVLSAMADAQEGGDG